MGALSVKKLITILVCVLASFCAWGDAYNLLINQRNAADDGNILRIFGCYTSPCVLFFDTSTNLPSFMNLGTGFSTTGGVLNIPVQVQPDWSAGSGFGQIANKPTTLAGYGITDGVTSSSLTSTLLSYVTSSSLSSTLSAYVTGSALTSALSSKYNTPMGTTAQYVRGDGTLATLLSSGTVTSVVAGTGLSGGTITTTGTISLPNTGTASTYSTVTTDAQGRVTAGTLRSFSYVTRSLNSCFQLSTARDVQVVYPVEIATTSTLASGQQGTVFLEVSDDSGCSVNTQEVMRFTNGNSQALGLTVTMVQTISGGLTGTIPATKYGKLRTQNVMGTPTFTSRPGQEVPL